MSNRIPVLGVCLLLVVPVAADSSPPVESRLSPAVVDWTDTVPLLSASFTDGESGLRNANYSIGTTPGDTDVVDWTRLPYQGWDPSRDLLWDFAGSSMVEAVWAADLDGDAAGDMFSARFPGVFAHWNDAATWTHDPPVLIASITGVTDIKSGDVDGDGIQDLVVVHDRNITFLQQGPGRTFTLATPVPMLPAYANQISLADADGDGDLDVYAGSLAKLMLARNDALGWTLQDLGTLCPSSAVNTLEAADVDHDGDTDVMLGCNSGQIRFVEQIAPGVYAASTLATSCGSLYDITIDDLDGAGFMDVAVVGLCGDVHVLTHDGSWTHNAHSASPFANLEGLDAGDLDGDGDLDLVAGTVVDGRYKVYRNDGGSFTWWFDSTSTGGQVRDLVIADINQDDGPDIVSGHTSDSIRFLTAQGYAGSYDWSPSALVQGVQYVNVRLTDWAGNQVQHDGYFEIRYDTEAPVVDLAFSGPLGDNDWYTGPVGIDITTSDTSTIMRESFIGGPCPPGGGMSTSCLISADGVHAGNQAEAEDAAGNTAASPVYVVKIDATPPSTTGSIPGGTHTAPPLMDIDFTDAGGIASITYRVGSSPGDSHSGGDQELATYSTDGNEHTADWSIPEEHLRDGDNHIQATITDRAGNTATEDLGALVMDLGRLTITGSHAADGAPVARPWGDWDAAPGALTNGTTWLRAENTMSTATAFTLHLPDELTGPGTIAFLSEATLYVGQGAAPNDVLTWTAIEPTGDVAIDVDAGSDVWIGHDLQLPGIVPDGSYAATVSWST